MLTRSAGRLRELLRAADAEAQLIVMVRDPRDTIASMRRWARERDRRGGRPLVSGEDQVGAMMGWFLSSYRDLLGSRFDGALDDQVMFVRYEDLVRDPLRTAGAIESFTRLAVGDPRSGRGWRDAAIEFTAQDERIGEAVTELYGRAPVATRLGSWGDVLSDEEAARVLRNTKAIVERFYPELLPA